MKKLRTTIPRPISNRFKYWLLAVFASAVLVGFSFIAVQQNYRQNANDPQVQYAQDISNALEQGASPEALGGNTPVDPRKGLGLFLVVVDENKKVQASTMQLDGKDTPLPPNSLFESAKKGQQRFTWKPQKDARIAVVMQHYAGKQPGFVLVGRSLKEVESREKDLAFMALGAFLAMIALSTLAVRIGNDAAAPKATAKKPLGRLAFEDGGSNETAQTSVEKTPGPSKKNKKTNRS